MFRLNKFINGKFMWSIENVGNSILVSDMAEIMMEMKHDSRLSLSLDYV